MKASLQKKKKKKSQFWRTPGFKGKQQTHKIYIYISMLRALTPHLAVAMRQPWPLQPHLALIQHLPLIKFIILKTHHQSITHYQTFNTSILSFWKKEVRFSSNWFWVLFKTHTLIHDSTPKSAIIKEHMNASEPWVWIMVGQIGEWDRERNPTVDLVVQWRL